MTGIDKFRLASAGIMLLVGLIIIIRAVVSEVLPVAIFGMVLVAFALYRLNQFRQYRERVGIR